MFSNISYRVAGPVLLNIFVLSFCHCNIQHTYCILQVFLILSSSNIHSFYTFLKVLFCMKTEQNSFTMKPKAFTCLQVQLLNRQRKNVGSLMAKTFCWQPVDFRGYGDFLSQKRQDILKNKHATCAKLRDQTADCTMGEKGLKRDSEGKEQTESSNMEAMAMCQHSPGHTGPIKKGCTGKSSYSQS